MRPKIGQQCKREIDNVWFSATIIKSSQFGFSIRYHDDQHEESFCSSSIEDGEIILLPDSDNECELEEIDNEVNSIELETKIENGNNNKSKFFDSMNSRPPPNSTSDDMSDIVSKQMKKESDFILSTLLETIPNKTTQSIFHDIESNSLNDMSNSENHSSQSPPPSLPHSPLSEALCSVCQKLTPYRCGRCQNTFYCSRKCQRKDWRSHQYLCSRLISSSSSSKNPFAEDFNSDPPLHTSIPYHIKDTNRMNDINSIEDTDDFYATDDQVKHPLGNIHQHASASSASSSTSFSSINPNSFTDIQPEKNFQFNFQASSPSPTSSSGSAVGAAAKNYMQPPITQFFTHNSSSSSSSSPARPASAVDGVSPVSSSSSTSTSNPNYRTRFHEESKARAMTTREESLHPHLRASPGGTGTTNGIGKGKRKSGLTAVKQHHSRILNRRTEKGKGTEKEEREDEEEEGEVEGEEIGGKGEGEEEEEVEWNEEDREYQQALLESSVLFEPPSRHAVYLADHQSSTSSHATSTDDSKHFGVNGERESNGERRREMGQGEGEEEGYGDGDVRDDDSTGAVRGNEERGGMDGRESEDELYVDIYSPQSFSPPLLPPPPPSLTHTLPSPSPPASEYSDQDPDQDLTEYLKGSVIRGNLGPNSNNIFPPTSSSSSSGGKGGEGGEGGRGGRLKKNKPSSSSEGWLDRELLDDREEELMAFEQGAGAGARGREEGEGDKSDSWKLDPEWDNNSSSLSGGRYSGNETVANKKKKPTIDIHDIDEEEYVGPSTTSTSTSMSLTVDESQVEMLVNAFEVDRATAVRALQLSDGSKYEMM